VAVLEKPIEVRVGVVRAPGRRFRAEQFIAAALVSPAILYMLAFLGYPLLLAIYFSVSDAQVQQNVGTFVGLDNYASLLGDEQFRRALLNSFLFTFGSFVGKAILGTTLAFLLLRHFPARKLVRGILMLPWTLPIALSILVWKFGMFDPQFSVVNWFAGHLGVIHRPYPNWLGQKLPAFVSVLTVNIWRGFPFTAVIVLAGLTSIPGEIIDSAKVDGANFWQRWNRVMVPMIAPILFVGLLFDVVFTFTDLSVVQLLTNGGPIDATEILPTLAYKTGILGGNLGRGSAVALFMFPMLFVAIVVMLRILKRRD
jgi:multiple sugar transport system permease protein